MKTYEADAEELRRAYLRMASSKGSVVDEGSLLRSIRERLLGELIICDPAYVLSMEERAKALIPQSEAAEGHGVPSPQD